MSIDRCMDKEGALYSITYSIYIYDGTLFSHKKKEIMPFAATWMVLEIIKLNEINQTSTNIRGYHLYVESKKLYK